MVVSNHGGRILDFNRSALEALPEVVDAVGAKVPVLLDSGIRSGGDIVKALALGAKAVLIGRPVAWGVGAFGARGVERVFNIFAEEMQRVLVMTGVGAGARRDPGDSHARRVGKGTLNMIFVIWGIVFVAGIWIISTYNTLTALRLRVQNAWHQIDVQLKRRYDLIPNLVETVKGYMQFEQDTLQKVIDARSKAMVSTGVKQIGRGAGRVERIPRQSLRADGELSRLEIQQKRSRPAGRAHDDGKPNRLRAPVLQRSGHSV